MAEAAHGDSVRIHYTGRLDDGSEVDDAYGARRDDLLFTIPRAKLPDGLETPVGAELQMAGHNGGHFPVRVTASDDDSITVDANHPLAGEALTFALKLVAID